MSFAILVRFPERTDGNHELVVQVEDRMVMSVPVTGPFDDARKDKLSKLAIELVLGCAHLGQEHVMIVDLQKLGPAALRS
jgi:hypothetical protein